MPRNEYPLSSLSACQVDLTAAHRHAVDAVNGLARDQRRARAAELAELCADAIAFCRRLELCVLGDQHAQP